MQALYACSLERAFKTPMLCDITQVHTGFLGIMPKVTHSTNDEHWGKIGQSKQVHFAKSIIQPDGWISTDKVLERQENKYWKIEVSDFTSWTLGFTKFVGEWKTTELAPNNILIDYKYTLHSNKIILYPLNWLFTKTLWRIYMKRVLKNIKKLAYAEAPYLYD